MKRTLGFILVISFAVQCMENNENESELYKQFFKKQIKTKCEAEFSFKSIKNQLLSNDAYLDKEKELLNFFKSIFELSDKKNISVSDLVNVDSLTYESIRDYGALHLACYAGYPNLARYLVQNNALRNDSELYNAIKDINARLERTTNAVEIAKNKYAQFLENQIKALRNINFDSTDTKRQQVSELVFNKIKQCVPYNVTLDQQIIKEIENEYITPEKIENDFFYTWHEKKWNLLAVSLITGRKELVSFLLNYGTSSHKLDSGRSSVLDIFKYESMSVEQMEALNVYEELKSNTSG